MRDEMLYDKIKNAGYQSQKQLRTLRPWDEVRVCIGRNGDVREYIFSFTGGIL